MRTAMIADDDEHIRQMLSEMLNINGVTVMAEAVNGKEAVELFEKIRPDIVLLDVSMPDYDGIYALERINRYYPSKTIMITGDTSKATAVRLQTLRPTAVLYKPVNIKDILDVINK